MMDTHDRRRALLEALVGPNRDLYMGYNPAADLVTNNFKVAMDHLTEFLMPLSDLIADGARWRDQQASEQYRAARDTGSATVTLPESP